MRTAQFDYSLPADLIAQEPCEPRDAARMLVAGRASGPVLDHQVKDLPDLLKAGDLLVLNTTRVIPARLFGHKQSGGAVEILLIHPLDPADTPDASAMVKQAARTSSAGQVESNHPNHPNHPNQQWRCLIRGRVQVGTTIGFADKPAQATVSACHDDGERSVIFSGMDVLELAQAIGHIPLPPYIRRADRPEDRQRYQTVFAQVPGSVAAPTASLHFTTQLLAKLQARGITLAYVQLSIGPGTFKPVDVDKVEDFRIHKEHCHCPQETVEAMRACHARGGRVIAAGTTVVRTLESAARQQGGLSAFAGWTDLFLHPPAPLHAVDGLLTNFHLPRSSLLMLVSCLCGLERLHQLYAHAIEHRYRFFSYGDCMLLLP